jgi:hypothetical protein
MTGTTDPTKDLRQALGRHVGDDVTVHLDERLA